MAWWAVALLAYAFYTTVSTMGMIEVRMSAEETSRAQEVEVNIDAVERPVTLVTPEGS